MRQRFARSGVVQRAAAAVLTVLIFGHAGPWGGPDARAWLASVAGPGNPAKVGPAASAARDVTSGDALPPVASGDGPAAADREAGPVPERPAPVPARVLTYNIRHGRGLDGRVDLERVARTIEAAGADVVVLQEVDQRNPRSGMVDQATWLSRRLGMAVVFGPTMRLGPAAYGNAVLTRLAVEAWRVAPLPSGLESRAVLQVRLRLPDGTPLDVWATHLGLDPQERLRQAQRIVAMLDAAGVVAGAAADAAAGAPAAPGVDGSPGDTPENAGRGVPFILAGDLNHRPGGEPVRLLTERLVDAHAAAGQDDGFTFALGGGVTPNARIDYILLGAGVIPAGVRVLDSDASDHRPVVADVLVTPLARDAAGPAPGRYPAPRDGGPANE